MATLQPVARRRMLGIELPRLDERALLAALTLSLLAVLAFFLPGYPALTRFRPESLQALPNVLAPLVVLALFIERGVEVVLAGWRNAGALAREAEVRQAIAMHAPDRQWQAKADLDRYTAESQRLAFFIAFVLSLLISIMGVRAIEMLVADQVVAGSPPWQQRLFVRIDILVTALLMTGGAEGIHKVVTAFTAFIEQTKERVDEAGRMRAAPSSTPSRSASEEAPGAAG